ncbi:MAG: hypothetical protein E7647_02355 [Ruminococcaceae bacterium]|nr:hypothetical protein [Oscillospiraceae bacterium]
MKKFLVALLVLLLLLLCGCGKKQPEDTEETTVPDTVTQKEDADGTDAKERIAEFFDGIFEDHTVEEKDSGEKVAVLTVPDFQKLFEGFSEGKDISIIDCIAIAKDNPDVTKELYVKLEAGDDENVREKLEDAFIFDMLVNSIGSVDIDLSDPAERTETEADCEND